MNREDPSNSGMRLSPWLLVAILVAYLACLAGLARLVGVEHDRMITAGLILGALLAIFWPSQHRAS